MAATVQHISAGANDVGKVYYGSWTTDGTKGDHVINFPHKVVYFQAILNSAGTNPNILIKHKDETDESLLLVGVDTATTASVVDIMTSPADSAGVTITHYSNGTSKVDVDSTSQSNSGTNQWFAFCKL